MGDVTPPPTRLPDHAIYEKTPPSPPVGHFQLSPEPQIVIYLPCRTCGHPHSDDEECLEVHPNNNFTLEKVGEEQCPFPPPPPFTSSSSGGGGGPAVAPEITETNHLENTGSYIPPQSGQWNSQQQQQQHAQHPQHPQHPQWQQQPQPPTAPVVVQDPWAPTPLAPGAEPFMTTVLGQPAPQGPSMTPEDFELLRARFGNVVTRMIRAEEDTAAAQTALEGAQKDAEAAQKDTEAAQKASAEAKASNAKKDKTSKRRIKELEGDVQRWVGVASRFHGEVLMYKRKLESVLLEAPGDSSCSSSSDGHLQPHQKKRKVIQPQENPKDVPELLEELKAAKNTITQLRATAANQKKEADSAIQKKQEEVTSMQKMVAKLTQALLKATSAARAKQQPKSK